MDRDNLYDSETILNFLPPYLLVSVRYYISSVDKHHFSNWVTDFCEHGKPNTDDGRKVVLTYDGYRMHMTLCALEILREWNLIIYFLPAHISGNTQPLDVVAYGPFKGSLIERLINTTHIYNYT